MPKYFRLDVYLRGRKMMSNTLKSIEMFLTTLYLSITFILIQQSQSGLVFVGCQTQREDLLFNAVKISAKYSGFIWNVLN